ncbi:hypothetical protein PHMEG_00021264 [Phytophthora megakarya]|uniref:Uncharacterized protein n=1 Tax=Phytophthora megakarya TaxID=4795 RepID=A0A225VLS4_9STRA|nr:hypothetical protein PHMEG_00021264 [Phytophthora megakarya]
MSSINRSQAYGGKPFTQAETLYRITATTLRMATTLYRQSLEPQWKIPRPDGFYSGLREQPAEIQTWRRDAMLSHTSKQNYQLSCTRGCEGSAKSRTSRRITGTTHL